jgi:hypothetical protein
MGQGGRGILSMSQFFVYVCSALYAALDLGVLIEYESGPRSRCNSMLAWLVNEFFVSVFKRDSVTRWWLRKSTLL